MKSKQELIEEWESAIEAAEFYGKGKEERLISYMKDFVSDLKQLDEPETLSKKWIDEHRESTFDLDLDEDFETVFIKVEDLQNLLVPKKEEVEEGRVRLIVGFDGGTESYYATDIGDALVFLTDYDARFTVSKEPMIPKFVAKWISIHHEQFDLYPALKRLENNALSWEDVYEWYRKNTRKFVDAYLTGKYEVEEEQKYIVRLPSSMQDAFPIVALGRADKGNFHLSVRKNRIGTNLTLHDKYLLTEQEIKGYDERYFAFAVKVEELEE